MRARTERISESNYFFRMSSYQAWLLDYIHQNPAFIQPEFRRNETLGFLQKTAEWFLAFPVRPKTRLSWALNCCSTRLRDLRLVRRPDQLHQRHHLADEQAFPPMVAGILLP